MQYKDFTEAKKSYKPFYQVSYYDRRKEYSGNITYLFYTTKKEAESAVAKMNKYNKQLFKRMLEVYKPFGVTEDNYTDYSIWNRLIHVKEIDTFSETDKRLFRYDKNRVGYCYIDLYSRNLKQEDEESERQSSESYSDGPYGGAFKDWNDFYRWKER